MDKVRLREQLKLDEGVVNEIYKDHLGHPTFGIGHLITDDDPEYGKPIGTEVSETRVNSAFEEDLEVAIKECRKLWDDFDVWAGEVQEILVNMMFNMGRPRLSKFVKMNEALANRNWKEAAKEGRDSRWYRQVTRRAERLMTRMENVE